MRIILIAGHQPAEELIEYAGRVCTNSEMNDDTRDRFIKARIREGHESILEHATVTFLIEGISRNCSHQLVRHRLASYSQESQRYVRKNKSAIDYVIPPSMFASKDASTIYEATMRVCSDCYDKLIDLGIKPEDARYLLPSGVTTRIVMSANLREWRHIIDVRCSPKAQWEIKEVMLRILDLLHDESPSVFQDLYEKYIEEEQSQ